MLPAFKVEIDALFEGTHVISIWKHCRGYAIPQLRGALKEVPTKPHSSGLPRTQVVWMKFQLMAYCLNTKFPLPTLLCAGYSVELVTIQSAALIFVTRHAMSQIFYYAECSMKLKKNVSLLTYKPVIVVFILFSMYSYQNCIEVVKTIRIMEHT